MKNAPSLEMIICYSCNLSKIPNDFFINNSKVSMIVNSNRLAIGHTHIPPLILPQLQGTPIIINNNNNKKKKKTMLTSN